MKNRSLCLGVAIFMCALLAAEPSTGLKIEGGSDVDASSTGGSVSGGVFMNEWSYMPSGYNIETGIYVDASIPEGSTGNIGYSYKGAREIQKLIELAGGTYDLNLKYDGSVEANVIKSSVEGYADAQSRIMTAGYINTGYGKSISGTARISSYVIHSGFGSANAKADGTASYDIIQSNGLNGIHGDVEGRTFVASTSQEGRSKGETPYAEGRSEIYTASSLTDVLDFAWANTYSSISSYLQVNRPDSAGKAWIEGYAKGKADCYVMDNASPRSMANGGMKTFAKAYPPIQSAYDSWSITESDYKTWDNSSPIT